MNILVIAATGSEIKPLLDWLHLPENGNRQIDILVTGVGLMATTYSLTSQVRLKRPDLVVQAGIAGTFNEKIKPGSVVTVLKDRIADLGVFEKKKFRTVFDLGLGSADSFPYNKGWLENEMALPEGLKKLKSVSGVSINEISTRSKRITVYQKLFDPAIESMEGAALHYVCLKENIPFIQLRGISNYIGERNKKKWKMKESIGNLNKELIQLLITL